MEQTKRNITFFLSNCSFNIQSSFGYLTNNTFLISSSMDLKKVILHLLAMCCLVKALPLIPSPEVPHVKTVDRNPKTMTVQFKQIGMVATAPAMVHVRIPVPGQVISDFTHLVMQKMSETERLLNITNPQSKQTLENQLLFTIKSLAGDFLQDHLRGMKISLNNFDDLLDLMGAEQRLKKRFWDLIGSIIGVAANIYNHFQLNSINTSIESLDSRTDHLVDIDQMHENHLANLDMRLNLSMSLLDLAVAQAPEKLVTNSLLSQHQIVRAMETFVDTVHSAREGKLSKKLLPGKALVNIKKHIEQIAVEKNMVSPIQNARDLFKLPVSTLFNQEARELVLFLHVPMVKEDNLMQLQAVMPLPLHLDGDSNHTILPSPEEPFLAVKHDTFIAVSQQSLDKCIKVFGVYYCRDMNWVDKATDLNCISSLFWKNHKGIMKNCPFEVRPMQEYSYKVGTNTWLISTPFEYITQVKCPGKGAGKRVQDFKMKGTTTLKIDYDCTLKAKQFDIQAIDLPGTGETLAENDYLSWDMNITNLLNVSTEELALDLKTFHSYGVSKLKLQDYTYLKKKYGFSTFHWGFWEWIHLGVFCALTAAMFLGITPTLAAKRVSKKMFHELESCQQRELNL